MNILQTFGKRSALLVAPTTTAVIIGVHTVHQCEIYPTNEQVKSLQEDLVNQTQAQETKIKQQLEKAETDMRDAFHRLITQEADKFREEKTEKYKRGADFYFHQQVIQQLELAETALVAYQEQVTVTAEKEAQLQVEATMSDLERYKLEQERNIDTLQHRVSSVTDLYQDNQDSLRTTHKMHRLFASVQELEKILSQSSASIPAHSAAWKEVVELAKSDPLLQVAVDAVPLTVVNNGVPSLPELRSRFKTVESAALVASFLPSPESGFLGQNLARFFSSLLITETRIAPDRASDDHVALRRAAFLLEDNNLTGCLQELNKLSETARIPCKDFSQAIESRLSVALVLDCVRTYALLQGDL